jgi:serine/threonine-protein kinase HipA
MEIGKQKITILVYAHWQGFDHPILMGNLHASPAKGKEVFSFEYDNKWLDSDFSQMIDPDLQFYKGLFYPKNKLNFGIFLDSCPDRWGKVLMQRREAAIARQEKRGVNKLLESDYLLGVYDGHRMGALRFKLEEQGQFLNDNIQMATPPWTSLSQLEQASLKFEENNIDDPDYLKWIGLLIAPGSSLGGARPKASVVDKHKNLWIAKFPSKNDDKDIGAWEMVVNELANKAGLNMSVAKIQKFNSHYHTYLTKRFDRTSVGDRIHFASAMTLLGHVDGEDSSDASYLEIAEFINRNGVNVEKDLAELWRRIVFSICVKNTDDHLRNHGFLLGKTGWELSPAYDINANEFGQALNLNISDVDNALDLNLALEVTPFFRLSLQDAKAIIQQVKSAVKDWQKIVKKYKIAASERELMTMAFENKL